jgi:hypothetical protein
LKKALQELGAPRRGKMPPERSVIQDKSTTAVMTIVTLTTFVEPGSNSMRRAATLAKHGNGRIIGERCKKIVSRNTGQMGEQARTDGGRGRLTPGSDL